MSPKAVPTASQLPSGLASMALARVGLGKSILVGRPDCACRAAAVPSAGPAVAAVSAVAPVGRVGGVAVRSCGCDRRDSGHGVGPGEGCCRDGPRQGRAGVGILLRTGGLCCAGAAGCPPDSLGRSAPDVPKSGCRQSPSGTGPRRRRDRQHRRSGPRRRAGAGGPGRRAWLPGRGRGRPCAAASAACRGIPRRWSRRCGPEPRRPGAVRSSAARRGGPARRTPAKSRV